MKSRKDYCFFRDVYLSWSKVIPPPFDHVLEGIYVYVGCDPRDGSETGAQRVSNRPQRDRTPGETDDGRSTRADATTFRVPGGWTLHPHHR